MIKVIIFSDIRIYCEGLSNVLSKIESIQVVGVENNSDHPISGELWLDELRLSGVKKERGTAVRLKSEFNLSDLNQSSFSYIRKDADFHILQERLGTNITTESFIFTNQMQFVWIFNSNNDRTCTLYIYCI